MFGGAEATKSVLYTNARGDNAVCLMIFFRSSNASSRFYGRTSELEAMGRFFWGDGWKESHVIAITPKVQVP